MSDVTESWDDGMTALGDAAAALGDSIKVVPPPSPVQQQGTEDSMQRAFVVERCLERGFLWLNCLPVPVLMPAIKEMKSEGIASL